MQIHIRSLSLTTKLFLFVFAAFSLLVGGLVLLVAIKAEKEADKALATSFERSRSIVTTALNAHYNTILQTARDVSHDPNCFAELESHDGGSAPITSLQDLSEESARSRGADVLLITDKRGQIVARSDSPELASQPTSTRSGLIAGALAGREGFGIMRRKNELLQIAAVPITLPGEPGKVVGGLALAYKLSPKTASELGDLTASEIAFFSLPDEYGKEKATPVIQSTTINSRELETFVARNPGLADKIDSAAAQAPGSVIKIGPELYQSIFLPLQRSDGHLEGFIAILRSRSELLRPFQNIEKQIAVYGFAFLLIASVVAAIFARRTARPIIELVAITKAIQGGSYPEPAPTRRGDEVGVLHNAIYSMSAELKEKADLERYLAQFSDSLELESGKPIELESQLQKGALENYVPRQKGAGSTLAPKAAADGTLFAGRYVIKQLLGEGAFGTVYLAQDPELNELLALKVIPKSNFSAADLDAVKREIRLARKITHRNVVRTYDFGVDGENYFISMEYVPGYNLYQLIKQYAPLPLTVGIQLTRQIVSAVAVAHQEGIIHRDLKPQNMIVNRQGILKIMDFGLAQQFRAPLTALSQAESANPDSKAEQAKAVEPAMAGSPFYMAPEQFTGGKLDERTDIYAIGVIMFQMFSGRLPFREKVIFALVEQIVNTPAPRLSSVVKNCPPQLDEIIAKALSKSTIDRFSSLEEMSKFLGTPIATTVTQLVVNDG